MSVTTQPRPLRVLTISKPYVAQAYRDKIQRMAQDPRLEVGLIVPPAWGSQSFEQDLKPATYWQKIVPIHLNGKNHFHWYASGIRDAVREFRPDILNIEEEHYSLVTFQLFRLAMKYGAKPVFYTWQNIAKAYPPPFRWMESYILRHAAGGICGNQESLDIIRAKGFSGPAAVIPQMGANVEAFAPQRPGESERARLKGLLRWDASRFWVLFAGRIVEEKGIQTLIAACEHLPDEVRSRVRIGILGGGPYQTALEAMAKESSSRERIQFFSPVASDQIARYLQAADVLCLPSLTRDNWKEQFGRILVEAMAAETVVVGSDSGEIPHVIGNAGLVFPEGDERLLAQRITQLASTPALVSELRAAGARRVRELYSNEVVARQFADFFCQI